MKNLALRFLCFFLYSITFAQEVDWVKSIGGSGIDIVTDIVIDHDNNLITVGHFQNTVDFNPGSQVYNMTSDNEFNFFILKTDNEGNFIWAKNLDQFGGNHLFISDVKLDSQGNIYLTGSYSGTLNADPHNIFHLNAETGFDVFIIKLNPNGEFIWAKTLGNSKHTYASSMNIDVFGNIYISGEFEGTLDFDFSNEAYELTSSSWGDAFILKLDDNGNLIWVYNFGDDPFGRDEISSIVTDGQGNLYATGRFVGNVDFNPSTDSYELTSHGKEDQFILKLAPDGSFIWVNQLGNDSYDWGWEIVLDENENLYSIGHIGVTEPVDFDPGSNTAYIDPSTTRFYIQKLDKDGNFIWVKGIMSKPSSISISPNEGIYIIGAFEGTIDFNPNSDSNPQTLTSNGNFDGVIQKLNTQGDYLWAKSIGGSDFDYPSKIISNHIPNLYIIGTYFGTCDFNTNNNQVHTSNGDRELYFLKINENNTLSNQEEELKNVVIYPNPSDGIIHLNFNSSDSVNIRVFSSLGKLVYEEKSIRFQNHEFELNIAKGYYFLEVSSQEKKHYYKLIRN